MRNRNQSGRATGSLIFLLLVLVVAGGWNYHRNVQRETANAANRPYLSYSVTDLESLRDAYAAELKGAGASFNSAKRERARPVGDVGSIAGNVEQFRKTTRASHAIRDAAAGVANRQSQLDQADRELAIRVEFGEGLARHIKRLTTI